MTQCISQAGGSNLLKDYSFDLPSFENLFFFEYPVYHHQNENRTIEVTPICELSHTINYKFFHRLDGFGQFDTNHLTLFLLRSLSAISMLLVGGLQHLS